MIEEQVIEIVKFSPVIGTLLYIIALMGKAIADRDKRINELIDRCVKPCPKEQNVDTDNI